MGNQGVLDAPVSAFFKVLGNRKNVSARHNKNIDIGGMIKILSFRSNVSSMKPLKQENKSYGSWKGGIDRSNGNYDCQVHHGGLV